MKHESLEHEEASKVNVQFVQGRASRGLFWWRLMARQLWPCVGVETTCIEPWGNRWSFTMLLKQPCARRTKI